MFRYYVNMYHCGFSDVITGLPGIGHSLVALVAYYCSFNSRSSLRVVGRKFKAMMITKSNLSNTITWHICNFNTIITIFSFSWLRNPFQGHGAGAGAYPSYMWAKAGSTPGWITSSSQGPMWAGSGTLLKGTMALLWRCYGTSPY